MQVSESGGARVIDMAAFRAARTQAARQTVAKTDATLGIQYCDYSDSAAWYHAAAVKDDQRR